ncbi:MAG: leucine-rich repeat protein [Oscillospiraceae bacterium]|nr:leucine-rich repeat protein [Oscillospiraceae bacterium]MBQ6946010.1 leucine-rich repeat protein [Ruminococcus sp.]
MKISKKIACISLSAVLLVNAAPQLWFNNTEGYTFSAVCVDSNTDSEYKIYGNYAVLSKWNKNAETANIPSEYNGLPVKEIADYAFWGCNNLASVKIPDGVTTIGASAFSMCNNLSEVSIPDSVTEIGGLAFNCTPWLYQMRTNNPLVIVNNIVIDGGACGTSVEILDGTVAISDYAFANCYDLETVKIPDSVKRIGGTSFQGTAWYENEMEVNECVIVNDTFAKAVFNNSDIDQFVIQNKIIGNNAFAETAVFTDLELTGAVEIIGDSSFYGCKNLKSFKIYPGVTTIEAYAFAECIQLKTFEFTTDKLEKIEKSAFENCSNLEAIELSENTNFIGENAFKKCSGLNKIVFNNPECFIYDSESTINKSADIYGYTGSTAEKYANKYDRTFIALDEKVTTSSNVSTVTTTASTTTTSTTTTTVTTEPVIKDGIAGDVNNDSLIDLKDVVMIRRYVAGGWNVDINADNADVNGDDAVNLKDVVLIRRYIAGGWDVELK